MARSESVTTNPDEYHIKYDEGSDYAELLVRTEEVTVTIEGEPEAVRRQFERYHAEALHITSEELAAEVEAYPMPGLDELESIPAEEFYGTDEP